MNRPIINMPRFSEGRQRIGRRRHPEPVIVCDWELRELGFFATSQLTPFAAASDTPSALRDVYCSPVGLVRRCRKQDGATFSPADIDHPHSITLNLNEFAASIRAEPDHPYFAMLSQYRGLPIVHPAGAPKWAPDPAMEWKERIILVDDDIFVPTLTPTLAVSLHQERGCLVAAASCPPMTSPALRMPTIHLPYETDATTLAALATDLGVELVFASPPEMSPTCGPATNQWINKTLADLYLYLVRKGVRGWPENLPFDELRRVYTEVLYAKTVEPPLDWFGEFLGRRSECFDHLATYIDALQDLILARYHVVGEAPPPDSLAGITL